MGGWWVAPTTLLRPVTPSRPIDPSSLPRRLWFNPPSPTSLAGWQETRKELTISALEKPVASSGPREPTGLMGTMIPEKRQTQTLLFCMWGATDPGAQALVDPERALWALGAGTAGSPPPLTRVERMLGSGSLLNRAWGGQCFPNQPLASWAPLIR